MSPLDAAGGGITHARGLAQGLRDEGIRVSLLCTGSAQRDADPAFDQIIARQPRSLPLLWRIPPLGTLPFWMRTIRAAAANVDAVIALSPVMALATRWAHRQLPLVYAPASILGLEHAGQCSAYRWIERHVLQAKHRMPPPTDATMSASAATQSEPEAQPRTNVAAGASPAVERRPANRILLTTPAVRRAIETLYGPLNAAVAICPLGVDTQRIRHATRTRADLGIPPDARLLLTIGPLIQNKGQRMIAQTLAECARPNWWWVNLGDGPDKETICRELRGSAMESRVRFIESDAQPADWYAAADVLVAASRVETFGLAIAEALCAGLPVVIPRDEPGTTLSPLADYVETFRLGRTYPGRSASALAAALTDVLEDKPHAKALGHRAAAFAATNFSWRRYAQCVLQLVEQPSDITCEVLPPEMSAPSRAKTTATARDHAYAAADGR